MKQLTIEEVDSSIKENLDLAEKVNIGLEFKYMELQELVSRQRVHYVHAITFYNQKCKMYEAEIEKLRRRNEHQH